MTAYFSRAAALCAVVLLPALAGAQASSFKLILTNSTPIPPNNDPLSYFADDYVPSRKGNSVTFLALPSFNNELPRLYRWEGGNISFVVGPQTPMPGYFWNFSSIHGASISGADTAFEGTGGPYQEGGVYRVSGGVLSAIADTHMTPPGGTAPFIGAGSPVIDGPIATFLGFAPGVGTGIYRKRSADLIRIADSTTVFPGLGNISEVRLSPAGGGGYNALRAIFDDSPRSGLYEIDPSDHLSLIADTNTIPPGRSTPFLGFNGPIGVDGPDVAFVANIGPQEYGLYRRLSGSMQLVAQQGQNAPGGGKFVFENSGIVSLSHGHVAFTAGLDPTGYGIYTDVGGPLRKVIGRGDVLGGKVIDLLFMNSDALEGDSLVFFAHFSDDSKGVYIATVPEAALIVLAPLAVMFNRRRRTEVKAVPSSQQHWGRLGASL